VGGGEARTGDAAATFGGGLEVEAEGDGEGAQPASASTATTANCDFMET
jgi:hypothetical protein